MKNSVKLLLSACLMTACTQAFAQTDTARSNRNTKSNTNTTTNQGKNKTNTNSKSDTTRVRTNTPENRKSPNRSATPADTTRRKNPGTTSSVIIN